MTTTTPSRRLATLDRQIGGTGSGQAIAGVLSAYTVAMLSTRGMARALRRDFAVHVSREKVRLALRDLGEWRNG